MENDLGPVLDALPGLVWTALPDGCVDFASQPWCEYTGLGISELLGSGWQTATHPEDLPDLLKRWRSILLAGEAGAMEARLRRFDGEYRWFAFRVRPVIDASGKIVKWFGLNVDIENRRRSDRAREDHFRSITDTIPAMISFMTAAGEVENVNQHFLEYVGTTLEELKGWKSGE